MILYALPHAINTPPQISHSRAQLYLPPYHHSTCVGVSSLCIPRTAHYSPPHATHHTTAHYVPRTQHACTHLMHTNALILVCSICYLRILRSVGNCYSNVLRILDGSCFRVRVRVCDVCVRVRVYVYVCMCVWLRVLVGWLWCFFSVCVFTAKRCLVWLHCSSFHFLSYK